MASTLPALAIPGQRLGPVTSYSAGPGTHVQQYNVYASIAGPVVVDPAQPGSNGKATLSVSRSPRAPGTGNAAKPVTTPVGAKPSATSTSTPKPKPKYNTLPAVDSVVLARVTRVQKRQATVSILVVLDESANTQGVNPSQTTSDNDNIEAILSSAANPENHSSSDELRFQALIRKEDVRAVEKDRVVMDEMFRVGDIVRGTIISLGDQSFYYLTTARNDLGVVMARSEAGNMMFPVSWKEMRDSVSGQTELRKVARPF
ncbi:exosome 3'-_5 exonuclease subunit ski4 (Csl4) [Aspergillus alliaceus]|uniref:Exosome 3'->5 exonuclease subunit ski4 (Csl4) n=1 Tax=Petromyces alliaceus TaxID=209559 RepID=A0A5N7BY04_PETAA|nr:exosome component EXOSC1/CSL4-domain-containing protein [Aspergillus alliaceus]KAB8234525.1 exosome component EXOSC1/CSL4-domain-containing protein [Aspergillus alliaceus]KAE8386706.1 exosome component EXOSC1/CSL4-domain-containing protein [Aspergillus alliaceus]KAF5855070.1 exosome 3'->5 exonuclease subunit ski4 (Csl4) [Aspergillus burnettii]